MIPIKKSVAPKVSLGSVNRFSQNWFQPFAADRQPATWYSLVYTSIRKLCHSEMPH